MIWLKSEKDFEKFASLFMFLAKRSPSIGYHGNNEEPILELFISKDGLYNGLKSQSFVKIG